MRYTKYHIGQRILWLIMALHILNFSIDTPHTLLDDSPVDVDYEEIDSIVELLLEDIMCIEDAIPENHSKSPVTNKFSAKKIVWLFEQQPLIEFRHFVEENYRVVAENPFYRTRVYASPQVNIVSPPPEA